MKKTLRLFVSSTFKDFESERRDLMCGIFPDLGKKLNGKGMSFLPIDLRWGVTEDAARLGKTMDICLSEVERACTTDPPPDFLLLLGNRYGWRPLPSVISKNDFKEFSKTYGALGEHYELDLNTTQTLLGDCDDGVYRLMEASFDCKALRSDLDKCVIAHEGLTHFQKVYYAGSATHQEFEIATKVQQEQKEKNSDVKSQLIVFLRSDSSEIDEDLKPSLKKIGLGVEAFTKQVTNYNISNDDLIVTFSVWERAKEHIASLDKTIASFAVSSNEKRNKAAVDFIEASCQTLVERDTETRYLYNLCQTRTGCWAVIGESGAGKSAVMANLVKYLEVKKNKDLLLSYRFIGIEEDCGTEQDLLASLIHELNQKLSIRDSVLPEDPRAYDFEFLRILADHKSQKFVFVLDALNQLSGERKLNWLQSLSDNVLIVVSLIEDANSQFENKFCLKPVKKPAAIVAAHLKSYNRVLTKDQEQALANRLGEKNALHLTLIALALRNLRSGQSIPVFPDTLSGMLDELHGKLCQSHLPHLVNRVLSLLLVPRYGVTEGEIATVLHNDHGLRLLLENHAHHPLAKNDPIPPVLWASLWEDIRPYIAIRNRHDLELLTFMHSAFGAHYSNWYAQEHTSRLLAKAYSAKIFKDGGENAIDVAIDSHVLEEIIGVSVKSDSDKSRECMEKLLTDLDFIRQRGAAGQVYDLLADYNDALDTWPGYERYSPYKEYRVPDWEREMTLEALSKSNNGDPDWSYECYTIEGKWPAHLSHAETCLRMRFAVICSEKGIDYFVEEMEKTPEGRIELYFQFVRSCSSALRHADECGTVAAEQAHRRAKIGLVAKQADELLAIWGGDKHKHLKYAYGSRSNFVTTRSSELLQLRGHTGAVYHFIISPDGKQTISASDDNSLIVWNLENGKIVHRLEKHSKWVRQVALSPDGKRAVSSSLENFLIVWDLVDGAFLRKLDEHKDRVTSFALCKDGKFAISGSDDKNLIVWDLERGKSIHLLEGHEKGVTSVVLSDDGKLAVSASSDKTLIVWDMGSGKLRHRLPCQAGELGHTGEIKCVVLSPDGLLAYSSGHDCSIFVWDLSSGSLKTKLEGHKKSVHQFTLSSDGKRAVSASLDYESNGETGDIESQCATIIVWDLVNWSRKYELKEHWEDVNSIALSSDAKLAISASHDKTLIVWDLVNGKKLRKLELHSGSVNHVSFSPDGKRAVSASCDRTLIVWDIESGQQSAVLSDHSLDVVDLAMSNFSARAASISFWGDLIDVWDLESGQKLREFDGDAGMAQDIALSLDGELAVSAHAEEVLVWNTSDGEIVHHCNGHSGSVELVTLSLGANIAVSASLDYEYEDEERTIPTAQSATLIAWDVKSGKRLHVLEGHEDKVTSIALSQHGKIAVSASEDTNLIAWDLASGKLRHKFEGHSSEVMDVVISPDEKRAISTDKCKIMKVWDLALGKEITYRAGLRSAYASVFSPDGKRVLSASCDHVLILWDIGNGKNLSIFKGHLAPVRQLVINHDGKRAVSVDADGTLFIWNLENGQKEGSFVCLNAFMISCSPSIIRVVEDVGNEVLFASINMDRCEASYATPHQNATEDVLYFCPNCGMISPLPSNVFEAIEKLKNDSPYAYLPHASPCVELAHGSWEEVELLSDELGKSHACSKCSAAIRFNPWILDENRKAEDTNKKRNETCDQWIEEFRESTEL